MTFWNVADIEKAKNNLVNFHQGLKSNVYSTPEAQPYQKDLIDLFEEVFSLDSPELLLTLDSKYHLLKNSLLEEFGSGYFAQYPNFHTWNQPVYDVPYLKTYILEIKSLPHFYQGKSIANYQKKYSEIQKLKSELETVTSTTLAEAQTATSEIVSLANTIHENKNLSEIVEFFTQNHTKMIQLESDLTSHLIKIDSSIKNIEKSETDIVQLRADIKNIYNELVQQLQTQKDEFNSLLKGVQANDKTLETQRATLKTLIAEVSEVKDIAVKTLGKANDIATFKEFDSVAKEKDKTRATWFNWFSGLTITIFVLSITISWWQGWFNPETTKAILTSYTQPWQLFAFYGSKLVVLPPLLGLAYFFLQRYLKESRIAEEYRFKATCALHFNSYIELVQKINIPDKADEVYRTFLIAQIKELFTSPTDKIYKNSNLSKGGELKAVSDTLELFVPQLTKIKGLLNSATGDHDNENKPS
jgi:hypothetical protein